MSNDFTLATEIGVLRGEISAVVKHGSITSTDIDNMLKRLLQMQRLAFAQEQELSIFRASEAGQNIRIAIEQLATDCQHDLANNVVRPEFGGRR